MAAEEDLTTAATAAARLGVSAADSALPGLVTAASVALADWVGYPLHRRTGVEETCQGGAWRLFLRAGAVQSVISISCYGSERAADSYRLEDGVKGIILALGEPWPFTGRTGGGVAQAPTFREDTGDIAATITCGWVTPGQVALNGALMRDLPHPVEQAALEVVTAWYSGKGRDSRIASMSTGAASVSWAGGEAAPLPMAAKALLKRYRKHVRG
jgi:hypothetical protein